MVAACLAAGGIFGRAAAEELTIGSQAPALDIDHWLQARGGEFQPVKDFAPGKVYVLEFWATWCGSCVVPHLALLQDAYADKGVQIIGVSDEDPATVEKFLGQKAFRTGDRTYGDVTKAYCLTTDPDRSVMKDYVKAAGIRGIPTAFIVGKTGAIEWIGHPMEMEEPLEKVVAGTWDPEAWLADKREMTAIQKRFQEIRGLLQGEDPRQAVAFVDELIASASPRVQPKLQDVRERVVASARNMIARKTIAAGGPEAMRVFAELVAEAGDSAERLHEAARNVVEVERETEPVAPELAAAAIAAAEKARGAEPENFMVLDTLAHLEAMQGDLEKAIATQRKAVALAQGRDARRIRRFLETLEAKAAGE
jgi:thiol-disulfide isomerase/thioredoxin